MPKATAAIGRPAVAASGLGVLVTSVVAPASVCIAPSEAALTVAARISAATGEPERRSAAAATTRTTGVRWSNESRRAAGKLNQARRRRRVEGIFMREERAR
jgi:hypothetical protein